MKLKAIGIRNFRRLENALIDVDKEKTFFVGPNNSGKTSSTEALRLFISSASNLFTIYDFSSSCWKKINELGSNYFDKGTIDTDIPTIDLDLWFDVKECDLYKVLALLPSLDWENDDIGLRLSLSPKDWKALLENFKLAKEESQKKATEEYIPWPKDLTDYLNKKFREEYEVKYFVLDKNEFDENFCAKDGYSPLLLAEGKRSEAWKILKAIIRVDFLNAQRPLSDNKMSRNENLSKRISSFYERNLDKFSSDVDAMSALSQSEVNINEHFKKVFSSLISKVNKLGYPGLFNPQMVIRTVLTPENLIGNNSAKLCYQLNEKDNIVLPDSYNGLGYQNLIFMIIEILDFNEAWLKEDPEERALVHIIVIEEPESHLHTQIQQVFIEQVKTIIKENCKDEEDCTQLIITTHSPHIVFDTHFQSIRYFKRKKEGCTEVKNLSQLNNEHENFLLKYMRLTHCDLFFSDAAIIVEGTERLLVPLMIDKEFKDLKSSYISLIELGGAYSYKFIDLIEFIGIDTLIITDIDSVKKNIGEKRASCCIATEVDAITSNATLKNLFKLNSIKELESFKNYIIKKESLEICVKFQQPVNTTYNGKNITVFGRTFEEMFALENIEWLQKNEHDDLQFKVDETEIDEIIKQFYEIVKSNSFKKTDFAIALMQKEPSEWNTPSYIKEGLSWLKNIVTKETIEEIREKK